ncbi:hypothetical protein [Acinetobacter terrestris]|uniref:Uncharacterized protein n=1 Tax=Acinetobacter terrestris TaxID=2529843 RepID=A0ABX1UWR0_9GAMM|nr:hypothetical protein [Acinetobacter terrestris]NNH27642.1 hypothetical protein [Acinetobacter terrestris]
MLTTHVGISNMCGSEEVCLPLGTEAKAHIDPFIFPFTTSVFTAVDKEPV